MDYEAVDLASDVKRFCKKFRVQVPDDLPSLIAMLGEVVDECDDPRRWSYGARLLLRCDKLLSRERDAVLSN